MHGEPNDVLELAALLGLKFNQDVNGQFAHSDVITILNAQGEIAHQQIGLNRTSRKLFASCDNSRQSNLRVSTQMSNRGLLENRLTNER